MRTLDWKSSVMWTALSLLFLLLALIVGPAPTLAGGPDAVLYEVAEDMLLLKADAQTPTGDLSEAAYRYADAALIGWAELGTPLCPSELLLVYSKAKRCALNANGHDLISLVNGTGPVWGEFTVVVNADNPADGPEAVVGVGSFAGTGSLAAALQGTPLGSLQAQGGVSFPSFGLTQAFSFTGTFRLPFGMAKDGGKHRPGADRKAFYLTDNGQPTRVRDNERSIGWPTVRLEITFD